MCAKSLLTHCLCKRHARSAKNAKMTAACCWVEREHTPSLAVLLQHAMPITPAHLSPPPKIVRALSTAEAAGALLVVGSSLQVYSAFKLVKAARRVAIVTAGPTRADALAELKVEALAGEALARLAAHPALLLPRLQ